ncbi:MAG: glycoside hydrolase family 3 C-terminal domain-containing protein, partial [Planctomycetota bacterium]
RRSSGALLGNDRRFRDEPVAVSTVPTVALGGDDLPQGLQPGRWSAIWRGRVTPTVSGTYHLVISGGDSYDLRVDEVSVASAWGLACHGTRVETIELTAGTSYAVEVRLNPAGEDGALQFGWIRPDAPGDHAEDPHAAAVAAAREADAVLVFAGSTHLEDCEGSDRKNFALPGDQDALIAKLAAANPRTAVFLTGGSAVALPWADEVPAIVQSYYAGMEGGHAVAAVACGRVNPSGKLAFTWPVRLEDCAAHALGEYATQRTVYREGWKVGYRWTTGAGPAPRFCFGHGLSYSSFALEDAELESGRADAVATIRCTLRNTGQHAGGEVVQLYLEDPVCSVERPARELKRFAKVFLEPGASQQVVLSVSADDLAFYDEQAGRWRAEPGDFIAHLGTSVDDIRISLPFLWEG